MLNDDTDLISASLQLFDHPTDIEDSFPVLRTVIEDGSRPSKFFTYRLQLMPHLKYPYLPIPSLP